MKLIMLGLACPTLRGSGDHLMFGLVIGLKPETWVSDDTATSGIGATSMLRLCPICFPQIQIRITKQISSQRIHKYVQAASKLGNLSGANLKSNAKQILN